MGKKEYRDFTEEEVKWIKSLKRVMKKAPDTLFMFLGSGSMVIYPLDENNQRYLTNDGSIDGLATNDHVNSPMEMDGGDW